MIYPILKLREKKNVYENCGWKSRFFSKKNIIRHTDGNWLGPAAARCREAEPPRSRWEVSRWQHSEPFPMRPGLNGGPSAPPLASTATAQAQARAASVAGRGASGGPHGCTRLRRSGGLLFALARPWRSCVWHLALGGSEPPPLPIGFDAVTCRWGMDHGLWWWACVWYNIRVEQPRDVIYSLLFLVEKIKIKKRLELLIGTF